MELTPEQISEHDRQASLEHRMVSMEAQAKDEPQAEEPASAAVVQEAEEPAPAAVDAAEAAYAATAASERAGAEVMTAGSEGAADVDDAAAQVCNKRSWQQRRQEAASCKAAVKLQAKSTAAEEQKGNAFRVKLKRLEHLRKELYAEGVLCSERATAIQDEIAGLEHWRKERYA